MKQIIKLPKLPSGKYLQNPVIVGSLANTTVNTSNISISLNTFSTELMVMGKKMNRFMYYFSHENLGSRAVAILRKGLGGPWLPQIFAWLPVCPPTSFFPNFLFKFIWLTYVRLPNAFCKHTGHFVNSARSKLCRNS